MKRSIISILIFLLAMFFELYVIYDVLTRQTQYQLMLLTIVLMIAAIHLQLKAIVRLTTTLILTESSSHDSGKITQ